MVSFGSQVGMLAVALKVLNIQLAGTSLAILGPIGLIAALAAIAGIGVVTYIEAQEEAHRADKRRDGYEIENQHTFQCIHIA